jgi:Kef-type K+ transport system membrane component KefB
MSPFVLFTLQLALMAAGGLVGGAVFRRLRQPAVVGEMIGGIVLGPTIFGALAPELQATLFPAAGPSVVLRDGAIKLGMLFFMFTVGLEINPRSLRQNGLPALGIGLLGTFVPLVLGMALVVAWPALFPTVDERLRWPTALFIGAAMANSANPVLARILLDLGLLKQRLGTIIMSATVIDDLVSWSLLFVVFERFAGVAGKATSTTSWAAGVGYVALLFVAVFVVGRLASRWLARWRHDRPNDVAGRLGVKTVFILAASAAAEHLGIHAFLGAFLFGIALAPNDDDSADAADTTLRRFTHAFFVPIYFVSLGLTTDFVANFAPLLTLVIVAAATVGKVPAAFVGARLGGLPSRPAWAVGWAMNARGATGIILANVGLERGVVDRPTYVALVVMAIVTSLAAGPMMKFFLPQSSLGDEWNSSDEPQPAEATAV